MDITQMVTTKELIFLILGSLLGGLASWVVAKITEKKRGLVVETTGRRIIIESADNCPFKISDLNEKTLDNVYLINIRIWNKGKEHVLGNEISKDCPLTISLDEETNILGEPIIFRGSDQIGLKLDLISKNTYQLGFECVNPDEWSEIGIFVEEKSDAKVSATGRVFGQDHDFNVTVDDGRASITERLATAFMVLFVVCWPFASAYSIYWVYSDFSFHQVIDDFDSLPHLLRSLLTYAMVLPLLIIMYYVSILGKRRGNPKTYPIDEDFEPSQTQNIGAMWGTAISGKRYRVSNSSKNRGEISAQNQGDNI
ncbi:hypothetical protein AB4176_16565 [Vibrio splendidus]